MHYRPNSLLVRTTKLFNAGGLPKTWWVCTLLDKKCKKFDHRNTKISENSCLPSNREVKHDVNGRRQRQLLIFSSFLLIRNNVSYYSLQIQICHSTVHTVSHSWRETTKVSFLPFFVCRKRHAKIINVALQTKSLSSKK